MSEKEMTGFDGLYGDTCISFIEYRRSLGYKYGEILSINLVMRVRQKKGLI